MKRGEGDRSCPSGGGLSCKYRDSLAIATFGGAGTAIPVSILISLLLLHRTGYFACASKSKIEAS